MRGVRAQRVRALHELEEGGVEEQHRQRGDRPQRVEQREAPGADVHAASPVATSMPASTIATSVSAGISQSQSIALCVAHTTSAAAGPAARAGATRQARAAAIAMPARKASRN